MPNNSRRQFIKGAIAFTTGAVAMKLIPDNLSHPNNQTVLNKILNMDEQIKDSLSIYYSNRRYEFPNTSITKDLNCNICIIGGGLTGLTTALNLARSGIKDIVLVEAEQIGSGASGVNGGQLSVGYESTMSELLDKYGFDLAKLFWQLSLDSVNDVCNNVKTYGIKCNLVNGVGGAAYLKSDFEELQQEFNVLKSKFNHSNMELYDTQTARKILASDLYHGVLYDKTSAHLNPLNYLLGITNALIQNFSNNVSIYVKSSVSAVKENSSSENINIIVNNKYTITANKVVLASNFESSQICSELDSKVIAVRDIILATETINPELAKSLISNNMAVFDTRNIMNYYRFTEGNHLLFGGGAPQGTYNKKTH